LFQAVRHLPASKQEEYRKLKQLYAERELQKKAQKPNALQGPKAKTLQPLKQNASLAQKPNTLQKSSTPRAQKSNAIQSQNTAGPLVLKPQELSTPQAPNPTVQAQKSNALQAQKPNVLQAQNSITSQALKPNAPQAQNLSVNALQAQNPPAILAQKQDVQAQKPNTVESKAVQPAKTTSPLSKVHEPSKQLSNISTVTVPPTSETLSKTSNPAVDGRAGRVQSRIEPTIVVPAKAVPIPEVSAPSRVSKPEYFLGAPIIYGQSTPPTFVAPSLTPKILALPVTNPVSGPAKMVVNHVLTTAVSTAPVKSASVSPAPGNIQDREKQLEAAEMNLLKQRQVSINVFFFYVLVMIVLLKLPSFKRDGLYFNSNTDKSINYFRFLSELNY